MLGVYVSKKSEKKIEQSQRQRPILFELSPKYVRDPPPHKFYYEEDCSFGIQYCFAFHCLYRVPLAV